jgi:hypothetical protein
MILIKGQSNCAKIERLVNELNDEVMTWVESLEGLGFKFSYTDLGKDKGSEDYAKHLMDQLSDLFDDEPTVH